MADLPETILFDCETNGFLNQMTRLWTLQIATLDNPNDVTVYVDDDADLTTLPRANYGRMADGIARLRAAGEIIVHNGVGFDMDAVNKVHPGTIRLEQIVDTLILARLADPTERMNRLEDHGKRLMILKGEYTGDFSRLDHELVIYAIQDVIVLAALYAKMRWVREKMPARLIEVEHRFARIMQLQERNGFQLDVPAAEKLAQEFRLEIADLDSQLAAAFPPITHEVEYTPKATNSKFGYVKGVPMIKRTVEVFEPGSRHHCARRLMALGWRPGEFNKDGSPTLDETTLAEMPWPEARLMLQRFTLEKKLGQIQDGKTGWLRLMDDKGRVHGRVNPIGCAPGRCSHSNPNLANVNKQDKRMRAVWTTRPGWSLVGIDGEGIQARALAHYLQPFDGGAFIEKIVNGNKKARTDVHSANLTELSRERIIAIPLDADAALWDVGRDGSKRCLYATWFGARDPKLGWTAKDACRNANLPLPKGTDKAVGAATRKALNRAIKGFEVLMRKLTATAKTLRRLRSPLGRWVPIKSLHSALVYLMQSAEADIMKMAAVLFHYDVAPSRGWVHGVDFDYVAHVHDEAQLEVRNEIAADVGAAYAQCITQAGVLLNLRCPLLGAFSVGPTWAATH